MKHLLAIKVMGYELFVEFPEDLSRNVQASALKRVNHVLSDLANQNSVTFGPGRDKYSACRCGAKPCSCGMFECHSHYGG